MKLGEVQERRDADAGKIENSEEEQRLVCHEAHA